MRPTTLSWLVLFSVLFAALLLSVPTPSSGEKVKVKAQDGRINLVKGRLGKVSKSGKGKSAWVTAAIDYLELPSTRKKMGITTPPNAAEQIREGDKRGTRRVVVKDRRLNQIHVYLQAFLHDLKVYGGEIEVHIRVPSKKVYLASGNRLLVSEVKASGEGKTPKISGADAIEKLLNKLKKRKNIKSDSVELRKSSPPEGELCYIFDGDDKGRLAYRILVRYTEGDGSPQQSSIFVSALSGKIILERPEVALAQNRRTYNKQGNDNRDKNGKRILSERSSMRTRGADREVKAAHVNAGTCYKFFNGVLKRDSIDGKGMTIHSNVHFGKKYNNAFWWKRKMFYGDGDGKQFTSNLATDTSVACHEMGHGVTETTAALVYEREPGALNEATSDIFGVCARANKRRGRVDWNMGYCKPGGRGRKDLPLRYMSNPTKDGYSKDYFPERIQLPKGQSPNRYNDFGGVHGNSGIANLFFKLLTDGGRHPRNKVRGSVQGIGWQKAVKIWYRALKVYFKNSSNFAHAREHTITAAEDRHRKRSREVHSVKMAWYLVGVGNNPGAFRGGGGGGGGGKKVEKCPARYKGKWCHMCDSRNKCGRWYQPKKKPAPKPKPKPKPKKEVERCSGNWCRKCRGNKCGKWYIKKKKQEKEVEKCPARYKGVWCQKCKGNKCGRWYKKKKAPKPAPKKQKEVERCSGNWCRKCRGNKCGRWYKKKQKQKKCLRYQTTCQRKQWKTVCTGRGRNRRCPWKYVCVQSSRKCVRWG